MKASKKKVQNFPTKIPSGKLQCGNSQLSLDKEAFPEAGARLDQVSNAAAVKGIVYNVSQYGPETLIQLEKALI